MLGGGGGGGVVILNTKILLYEYFVTD